jgi:flagellar biosynthesis/type III secretory pathway protein FliH
MGRVIFGARRVAPGDAAAYAEAPAVREAARLEAERIAGEAHARAGAELEEARRRGRAEGVAQAARLLAEARAERARASVLREREVAELALAVARRVVGDCRALDPQLVARRVTETIERRFLGAVVVRAAPAEAARIREALAASPAGERPIDVREDAALGEGCSVLEGDGGEVRLDEGEMLERLGKAMMDGREADG